ncbi:MAG TPA: hypothetical protein VLI94_05345 [Solirubrobacterales bacterium]|nr:hypothetical protein [Solirubrobacterales bacterium]
MPVRNFAAGGVVRTAVGLADTPGAMTYVAFVSFGTVAGSQWMIARHNASHASAGSWAGLGREPEIHFYPAGQDAGFTCPTGEWVLVAAVKAAGSSKANYYYYRFATGTWSSAESTLAYTSAYAGAPAEFQLGRWNNTEQFTGRYAAAMVFDRVLSEAEVKDLVNVGAMTDWLGLGPKALWTFDQQSVGESVKDITGNGADQTTIEGTTVLEEEPPIPYRALRPGTRDLLGVGR